jgi:hypothetical protein
MSPLQILLLCNRPVAEGDASTVTDHLDALKECSRHRIQELSFLRRLPSGIDLDRFDVIVVHYSLALGYMRHHYITDATLAALRQSKALKIVFIQDEYRNIDAVHDALRQMGADLLFTCVPTEEIEKVYPTDRLPGITKINNLTGYVPARLTQVSVARIEARPIDVGYRSRKPAFWLGRLAQEKWTIVEDFARHARGSALRLDLSYRESDRLYGDQWTSFVASCRTMLGVESGASVFDFTGELQVAVDTYCERHPDAEFEDVHGRFLRDHEGRIRLNQISPRCFESAALRTGMVLFRGEYSGALVPGRHYVVLEKDFSNIEAVINRISDQNYVQEMVDCAFEEVAKNERWSYQQFVAMVDDSIQAEFERRGLRRVQAPYSPASYRAAIVRSPAHVAHRISANILQRLLLGTRLRKLIFRVWGGIPSNLRQTVRPLLRFIGR